MSKLGEIQSHTQIILSYKVNFNKEFKNQSKTMYTHFLCLGSDMDGLLFISFLFSPAWWCGFAAFFLKFSSCLRPPSPSSSESEYSSSRETLLSLAQTDSSKKILCHQLITLIHTHSIFQKVDFCSNF